ncbi:MAG: universal stress protein [Xanthobacteraceae bacterium]|jgi:nucleotide-binding universal stress UspA family protein
MYKHILIPTDGSQLAAEGISRAIALAKALSAEVTGITVTAPSQVFADTKRTTAMAEKYLGQIKDAAAAAGVRCRVIHAEHERPYQAIIDTAKKNSCDLIVMASHGRRGVSALVLGSETVKVLTHSSLPVLVYR